MKIAATRKSVGTIQKESLTSSRALTSANRRCAGRIARVRTASVLVRDQGVQISSREALAAPEERQLDDEARADDLAAELLHELGDRLDGAARGEHVVVDDDFRARWDQIGVQLK